MEWFGSEADLAYPSFMGGWAGPASGLPGGDADYDDVQRFKDGSEDAFEALVTRYEAEMYRVAFRLLQSREDAMEAVQESFLRAYRALPKFRGDSTFRTWLTGITINVCRNIAASAGQRGRTQEVPIDETDPETGEERSLPLRDSKPDPEAEILASELRSALMKALGELTVEHREVLVLREIMSLEYDEMAGALGCAVGTIKSRLARARDALRGRLKGVWP